MDPLIRSLHHVTATVDDAQADLDFAARGLGLRLVKKTINFDNPGVYHFYYGDEAGTPGTIWTTFPYKGKGVPTGTKGAGQITVTSFSVPDGALDFWQQRLMALFQTQALTRKTEFGEDAVTVVDPSGLFIQLIGNRADQRAPWLGRELTADQAIRGLHSVTLTVRDPKPSIGFLTDVLGFKVVNEAAGRTRLATGSREVPGQLVEVVAAPNAGSARNGLGTVHHVAFAVDDPGDQLRIRIELVRLGHSVTDVLDRCYFQSIYFREPGGILYEIATIPPGFEIDETRAELGHGLKLPPWEESRRTQIATGLPPISL